jgi:DNA-binding MarR family transcriptional regulator
MTDRAARDAWRAMSALVLDNQRRREVGDAVGLPFSRVRALWRVAASPRTPGELAALLNVDPANCTPIVDDLEQRGLVAREPHPSDRRSKLVVITAAGARTARKAQRLWDRPPAALGELSRDELETLAELLSRVRP